jgi:hypothetical protein
MDCKAEMVGALRPFDKLTQIPYKAEWFNIPGLGWVRFVVSGADQQFGYGWREQDGTMVDVVVTPGESK